MDKSKTVSISLTDSQEEELKQLAFDLDASRSEIIKTALLLYMPVLKRHPLLLKYSEFETVKQHFHHDNGNEKTGKD